MRTIPLPSRPSSPGDLAFVRRVRESVCGGRTLARAVLTTNTKWRRLSNTHPGMLGSFSWKQYDRFGRVWAEIQD